MTRIEARIQIITLCKTLGFGVNFRGPSDPHLATVVAREADDRVVTIVSGRLAKVLDYLELVAA
jgi:hypothetical protein